MDLIPKYPKFAQGPISASFFFPKYFLPIAHLSLYLSFTYLKGLGQCLVPQYMLNKCFPLSFILNYSGILGKGNF